MATVEQEQNRTEIASNATDNILGPNPIVGLRARNIFDTAGLIVRQAIVDRDVTLRHTGHWLTELFNVATGKTEIALDKKDRRFQDAAWQDNWFLRFVRQTYQLTDKEMRDWLGDTDLSQLDKARAEFVMTLFSDAFA